MRALFVILLTLFAAASATLIAFRNPGYVLIAREPFVLETSVAVFVLIAIALFIVFYLGVRFVVRIVRVPHNLGRWRQTRRTRKAREAFLNGLTHLLAGEWFKAEQELVACLHAIDAPLLGYLGAALAAQGQGNVQKRDHYLARARAQSGKQTVAADMTHAQIQLLAHQNEQALATLTRLQTEHPHQAQVLRLLIETHRRLHDWQSLAQLLPQARQRELLPEVELDRLERETQCALLSLPLPPGALSTLNQAWSAIPATLRQHPDLVSVYARQLLRQDAGDEAAILLASSLDRNWDERLVLLYGEAQTQSASAQLETAEEWQARHGNSAALLLTLGRLARRSRLNDRARQYLEKSLALAASAAAHAELGFLFEETGDSTQALRHCRQALELCQQLHTSETPSNPRPGANLMTASSDYGY